MKTSLALAALGVLVSLGSASAHPTGDGHHFRNGYFEPHAAPYSGPSTQPYYGPSTPVQPQYHAPKPYHQPTYRQPTYRQPPRHGPASYGRPTYQTEPYYAPQPNYASPQTYAPQPAYSAPQPYVPQQSYAPQPNYSAQQPYAPQQGYAGPHPNYRRQAVNPYFAPRINGIGADNARSGIPTESYNFGYAGGPTVKLGGDRIINGVKVFGPPSE